MPRGPARAAVERLQVEEQRLDDVGRDLAAGQLGEVPRLDQLRAVDVDLGALDDRRQQVAGSRVVRAVGLLAQQRGKGRQHLRHRRRTRCAARDPEAGDVPRLRGVGVRVDPPPGRGDEVGVLDDLVDEPLLERVRSAEAPAGQQHVLQRGRDAEQARHPYGAARAGHQPERHLGEPDHHPGVTRRDPVVARQRDLVPAAERRAVDRRDDRAAEGLQPSQRRRDRGGRRVDRGCVVGAGADQHVEVATGEEGLLGRRDHDTGERVALRPEPVDEHRQLLDEPVVHRVGRLRGVVESDDHDAVLAEVPLEQVVLGRGHALLLRWSMVRVVR